MIARILGVCAFTAWLAGTAIAASTASLKPIDPVAIESAVEAVAKEFLVPGALIALHTPNGNFVLGYGTTELGTANAPRANTHFRAASNTKTMTAAVIVQLAQERKLRLDDPISTYVQDVPNGDHITIDQLLRMRSGLYNYTNAPELAESLDRDPGKVWSPEELRTIAFKHPPLFPPGAEYDYCNTNYLLLGLIVEKIEGQSLASSFQTRLFGPLGMNDTALPAGTSNTLPGPFSHGYLYGGSSHALVDAPYPADVQQAAKAGTLKPNDDTWQNSSYAWAAGGVTSTADDLATWMRALVGGKVLGPEYQRQWMASPAPVDPRHPDGQKYGYGITEITFGSNRLYFHGGEMPGYNSFMGYDPVNDVTLVVWTSLTLSVDGRSPANTLMLRLLDLIYTVVPPR